MQKEARRGVADPATAGLLVPVAPLRTGRVGAVSVERSVVLDGVASPWSRVPPGEPVQVDAVLERAGGGVIVRASVRAPWSGECRRCLEEVHGELAVEAIELYTDHQTGDDEYPISGESLDLALMVRDALGLELPLAPVCKDGCLGLCATCGANRNVVTCSCEGAGGSAER